MVYPTPTKQSQGDLNSIATEADISEGEEEDDHATIIEIAEEMEVTP